jgi:hypothetical protein
MAPLHCRGLQRRTVRATGRVGCECLGPRHAERGVEPFNRMGPFWWFVYTVGGVAGWIAAGIPVLLMHDLEMNKVRQPPPPTDSVTASELQSYRRRGHPSLCRLRAPPAEHYGACCVIRAWWVRGNPSNRGGRWGLGC